MVISQEDFRQLVAEAYDHLYDMAYLRGHPLTDLVAIAGESAEESAWRLHHRLLEQIKSLDPGQGAPTDSTPWRRYRLLHYHYVEGESPQVVADMLGISRRHFYREKTRALAAIAETWWLGGTAKPNQTWIHATELDQGHSLPDFQSRLDLLRQEADRAAQGEYIQLAPVLARLRDLCQVLVRERQTVIDLRLAEGLPSVHVDEQILLHILLGLVEHSLRQPAAIQLTISGSVVESKVRLMVQMERDGGDMTPQDRNRIVALEELATTQGINLGWEREGQRLRFNLVIPARPLTTVLVVDDNPDIHQLFQRYLAGYSCKLLTACDAQTAFQMALEAQPDVMTIDLMMPEQDGLTLLSRIRNHPATLQIPTIICSVLEERLLALSLGADYFLVKPITQEDLLTALRSLELIAPRPDEPLNAIE